MPEQTGDLLVAGSIALDTIETPSGVIEDELGGSAMYFALAAGLIMPVRVVAPVGEDAVDRVREVVGDRPIDLTHLHVLDAPTYRWRAHHAEGRNIDLGNRDSIYDLWEPAVPEGYAGWAFVGSMRPDRQVQLMRALASASLLAADSMISYIHAQTDVARQVVSRAAWYFCNRDEFAALGGDDPDTFRRRWWLKGLVLKSGAAGVTTYTEGGAFHIPALQGREVADTTGAGDAMAAGILARWLSTGGAADGLVDALVWGVACASLAIGGLGVRALAGATQADLAERVEEVRQRCLTQPS